MSSSSKDADAMEVTPASSSSLSSTTATATGAAAPSEDKPKLTPEEKVWYELQTNIAQLEKGVVTQEGRHVLRVLRTLAATRKQLTAAVLSKLIHVYLPNNHPRRELLKDFGEPLVVVNPPPPSAAQIAAEKAAADKAAKEAKEKAEGKKDNKTAAEREKEKAAAEKAAAEKAAAEKAAAEKKAALAANPPPPVILTTSTVEVDAYLGLLFLAFFLDKKQFEKAAELGSKLISQFVAANARALDPLISRIFFIYARVNEGLNKVAELRPFLHDALRTATLRHDEDTQATLLIELLHNLIGFSLYEQAEKLASKTNLPKSISNNQYARYLYYVGRIKAIHLDYSEAKVRLTDAIRKAPQAPAAPGFQQAVYKLSIIVTLLLGEIPERSTFRIPVLRKTLQPYLQLTQAVRNGDLRLFQEVVDTYAAKFQADNTYTLILRLRHNVIKTGVRMISVSYSSISLAEIAQKLHLESAEDAEYIAAKAIRDGVIEAVLDHKAGTMSSKEVLDVYSTTEPLKAFHSRLSYCLDLHSTAVKALRYPSNAHKKNLESIEDRKEREREEAELANELADGGDGDDDMI